MHHCQQFCSVINSAFFVTVRAGMAYWKIWWLVNIFCSHNKVHCSEIPIILSNFLYHYRRQLGWNLALSIKLWRWIGEWTDRVLHFASDLKWSRKMRSLSVFYFSFEISIARWLLSRPNWRIVSKLTTDVVTYVHHRPPIKNQNMRTGKYSFTKKALVVNVSVGCNCSAY